MAQEDRPFTMLNSRARLVRGAKSAQASVRWGGSDPEDGAGSLFAPETRLKPEGYRESRHL
jgi:hypothetical protein